MAALTTEIVSAYVSHHEVPTGELGQLISAVAGQLRRIGSEPEQPTETRPEPAVPVRRSIKPDHFVCLVCGNKQKVLKRHLAIEHGLTPEEYRRRFELAPDYPMASPDYTQKRRELALQIGLGRPKKLVRKGRKSTSRAALAPSS